MKILFPKSLCLALGLACLPALAVAQSYLPLPETTAPVYRPVSSYYADNTTGSSLIETVSTPPVAEVNEVPSPSDSVVMPSPAASYGKSVMKGGKGCCGGHCGCWYGGAYSMFLDRDNEREMQITVYNTNERDAILNNLSANMETTEGYQITIGRLLNCGTSAFEATYWEVDPNRQTASVVDPNALGVDPDLLSAFDLSTLNYDDGLGGVSSLDGWVDGAQVHQLSRNWDIRNIELNFLHHTCCGTCGHAGKCGSKCGSCCNRWEVSMLGGFRHFRFDENFLFQSDEADAVIDGSAEEVRYLIDLENRLYGCQLGCRADYYHGCKWGFHAAGKFGVYGNDIDHWSFIGGERGAAVVGAGPNAGRAFDIRSNKTEVSFLSELDLGVSYRFSCRWRAHAGYRVVAISGIALTEEQVPVYFQDIDGVANIDSESSLVLHGGYAGLEFNY